MIEETKDKNLGKEASPRKQKTISRRDMLSALGSIPVFGGFLYGVFSKKSFDDSRKQEILEELGMEGKAPEILPSTSLNMASERLRIGIIGHGGRGEHLVRAAGFAHPDTFEITGDAEEREWRRERAEQFLSQEDLNVRIAGVCDVFDIRAERGIAASINDNRPGGGKGGLLKAKRFRRYEDLLEDPEIDAVIIATPDHWHARMTLDAIDAGKHVYCEKCITRTEEEVLKVTEAVEKSDRVFQLGHQNPQQESFKKAKEIVQKGILGKITLVETTTNRNSPNGAWVYDIHPEGSPETIDWESFQEPSPNKVPFSLERFFRWRCWYDYGTGLSGDLFSHEFDAANQILGLGIPYSVMASGGIYYFKDGRDVPDVFQVTCEYPDRDLTLVYSATLANSRSRGRVFMGHDASLEVGGSLTVIADSDSTRYKDKIEREVIDPSLPLFSFRPGSKGIDTVTSATEKYFATKGLMYTFREGKQIDLTHLHVKDWIDCIRTGREPSCSIRRGFEEGITCHMATRSYLEGRRVEWDPVERRII